MGFGSFFFGVWGSSGGDFDAEHGVCVCFFSCLVCLIRDSRDNQYVCFFCLSKSLGSYLLCCFGSGLQQVPFCLCVFLVFMFAEVSSKHRGFMRLHILRI